MVDGSGSVRTRLNLEECVLAHLHVHEPSLALFIVDSKRLGKAHRLRVERNGRVEVRNVHSDVIHLNESGVGCIAALSCNCRKSHPHEQPGNKHD